MKKSINILLPLASVLLISSCGTTKPEDPGVSTTGFIKNPTTIVFSTTANKQSQTVLQRYIEDFKEIEPNVTVKLDVVQGGYGEIEEQTSKGFTTQKHPDLAMVYPDAVANYISRGFAYKLDPYIDNPEYGLSAEDKNDIIDTFLAEGQNYIYKNSTYSMPMSKSTEMMFYSPKLIDLTLPGVNGGNPIKEEYINSLTWDELFNNFAPAVLDYAKANPGTLFSDKVKFDDKNANYAVLGYDSDDNLFITLAQQYGIPYTEVSKGKGKVLWNSKEMKDIVKEFAGYTQQHLFLTRGQINERPNDLFKRGEILLSIGSTAGIKYQWDEKAPKEVLVAPIPQHSLTNKKVILQGPSVSFLAHKDLQTGEVDEDRKLASWLFYKHMIQKDNALDWSLTANYMPIRKSGYETDEYKYASDPSNQSDATSFEALIARVNQLNPKIKSDYFTSPAFKGSSQSRKNVGSIIAETFKAAAKEGVKGEALDKKIEELFKKYFNATLLEL